MWLIPGWCETQQSKKPMACIERYRDVLVEVTISVFLESVYLKLCRRLTESGSLPFLKN